MISLEEPNPGWYYDTAWPIPKNKRQGRPYDGIPISSLLKKVEIVLRTFDTDR
jgi:hypothetical protein